MPASKRILIVDDQPEVREYIRRVLEEKGYEVIEAKDPEEGFQSFRKLEDSLSLVILDLDFGSGVPDGLDLLERMRAQSELIPILILTGKGTAASGAQAIRLGAAEVLEKDLYIEETLDASVDKIERLTRVVDENRRLSAENDILRMQVEHYAAEFRRRYTLVGKSDTFQQTIEEAKRIANVPRPVLIRGERGTGKELIAALIHYHSARADKPFVTINCAAFAGNLLESEMFGHEKGAFTGADQLKIGRFELADGGTLFLDEIGNMPMDFQEKILRVLEYQKFERIGSSKEIKVDVRVVAATNANLEEMMKDGSFRPDLYDRLTFKELNLPKLSERADDIPELVAYFRSQLLEEIPWVAKREFSPEAVKALGAYSWPGNIRQLKNVVERLLCASDHELIEALEVSAELGEDSEPLLVSSEKGFQNKVTHYETQLLLEALKSSGNNQRQAAESLDLTYDQFRHLYKKYNLKDRLS